MSGSAIVGPQHPGHRMTSRLGVLGLAKRMATFLRVPGTPYFRLRDSCQAAYVDPIFSASDLSRSRVACW